MKNLNKEEILYVVLGAFVLFGTIVLIIDPIETFDQYIRLYDHSVLQNIALFFITIPFCVFFLVYFYNWFCQFIDQPKSKN